MIISIPEKIEDISEEYLLGLESLSDVEEATHYDFTIKTEPEDLRKKLCSFSNMGGGYYFIGIKHEAKKLILEGAEDKVSTDWILDIAKLVTPHIKIVPDKITVKDRNIYIIKIYPDEMLPHQVNGTYYMKIGSHIGGMPESFVDILYNARRQNENVMENILIEKNYGLPEILRGYPVISIIASCSHKIDGLISNSSKTFEVIKKSTESLNSLGFYGQFKNTHYGYRLHNGNEMNEYFDVFHYGLLINRIEFKPKKDKEEVKIRRDRLVRDIANSISFVKEIISHSDYQGSLKYYIAMQNMDKASIIEQNSFSSYDLNTTNVDKMIPQCYEKEAMYLYGLNWNDEKTRNTNDITSALIKRINQSFGKAHWNISQGGSLEID